VPKASRLHHSDEFGKVSDGSIGGLDAPTIGAAGMIITAGITERESGVTPPPPSVSVRAVIIGLVVVLVLGLALLTVMIQRQPAGAPGTLGESLEWSR